MNAPGVARAGFAALAAVVALGIGFLLRPATRLLVGGLDASTPVWSPTGEHLAFLVHDSLGVHVGVYDFARGAHRLAGSTPGEDASAVSWSPDGKRLAYTAFDVSGEGRDVIEIYDLAAAAAHVVAPGARPQWRADGSIVAVCGPERPPFAEDSDEAVGATSLSGDADTRFCRIDADTGEVIRTALAAEPGMALSPLLDRVLVSRPTAEGSAIFVASLEQGEVTRVAAPAQAANAAWTPAGDRIVFTVPGAAGVDLWTVRADGREPHLVIGGVAAADPASIRLSTDGTLVFFIAPVEGDQAAAQLATGGAPADLHVVPVGGGPAVRLASRHPWKRRYAVARDGKSIAYEILTRVRRPGGPGKREIWFMSRPERP